jgi:hypothetical protein
MDKRKTRPRANHCPWCGGSMAHTKPQARYCSRRCKLDNDHQIQTRRAQQAKRDAGEPLPGDVIPCANPQCFNAAIYTHHRAFCSSDCTAYFFSNRHWLGEGPSTQIYFRPCPDCQTPVTMTNKGGTLKVCECCRVSRNKAINGRKNHARRANGALALSVDQLAARDGTRCHICCRKVDMSLSGQHKWGPTIEHILPVSLGGTNDANNLALAHRHCNTARGNRGHSQLSLIA